MRPKAYDIYCGLGGWTEGLLASGWQVTGFDIEPQPSYPGEFVQRDVRDIHGSELADADLIVASPSCQEFSYRAMPWKRAKALGPPVDGINLFWQCWRIQQEAIEASSCGHCEGLGKTWAGVGALLMASDYYGPEVCSVCNGSGKRYIPMVVENVRGAEKWVGGARWHYSSYYLWGDVPAIMPFTGSAQKANPDGTNHGQGSWFKIADSVNRGARKVPGMNFHDYEKTGKPGRSFQSAAVARLRDGQKSVQDGLGGYGGTFGWNNTPMRRGNSKSAGRKAASAQIAKIPYPLARHIAEVFFPFQDKARIAQTSG